METTAIDSNRTERSDDLQELVVGMQIPKVSIDTDAVKLTHKDKHRYRLSERRCPNLQPYSPSFTYSFRKQIHFQHLREEQDDISFSPFNATKVVLDRLWNNRNI